MINLTKQTSSTPEQQREADQRRGMIEVSIFIGILLILEQLLLPFPSVTKSRLEVGTVLLFSNLWFLLYGVLHPKQNRE